MTAAEWGAFASVIAGIVGALTWLVTTRNSDRSFTANEEQAFFERQMRENQYLANELRETRDDLNETRDLLDRTRDRLADALSRLADCIASKGGTT